MTKRKMKFESAWKDESEDIQNTKDFGLFLVKATQGLSGLTPNKLKELPTSQTTIHLKKINYVKI